MDQLPRRYSAHQEILRDPQLPLQCVLIIARRQCNDQHHITETLLRCNPIQFPTTLRAQHMLPSMETNYAVEIPQSIGNDGSCPLFPLFRI